MNIKSLIGAACTCLSFACLNASAAVIVDQNQDVITTEVGSFITQNNLIQSFQQSNDNVAGAGIFLRAGVGTSDTVTISLWDALPYQGGNMLESNSATGTQGSWVDVFWTPVSVTPNTTLFLLFNGNTTLSIAGGALYSNPYTLGDAYADNTNYNAYGLDYAFRTYADVVVPVPAAAWLFGSGLFGLIGFARRKARK